MRQELNELEGRQVMEEDLCSWRTIFTPSLSGSQGMVPPPSQQLSSPLLLCTSPNVVHFAF